MYTMQEKLKMNMWKDVLWMMLGETLETLTVE